MPLANMTLVDGTNFLRVAAEAVFGGLGTAALFALPLVFVGWNLHRRRKQFRLQVLDPFTELPLRPPGEALRLKIDDLKDEFDSAFMVAVLVVAGASTAAAVAPAAHSKVIGIVLFIGTLVVTVYSARNLWETQRNLWDYRLGFTGERVVGEELNQLLTAGFKIFHDVPFDKFNIDHVLVGPPGVYAIETKAVRKHAHIKGLKRATVTSDGTVLTFPEGRTNTEFIAQARLNAESLSKWLTSATGEPIVANAILTIPGWRIERLKAGDVNVLRPDEIKRSFPTRPRQPLAPDQIARISHQLAERCRLVGDSK